MSLISFNPTLLILFMLIFVGTHDLTFTAAFFAAFLRVDFCLLFLQFRFNNAKISCRPFHSLAAGNVDTNIYEDLDGIPVLNTSISSPFDGDLLKLLVKIQRILDGRRLARFISLI